MKKFKQFFEEKIILSAVMCVLLAVVLVTSTYGWYALNNTDRLYALDLNVGGTGGLKVAIKPDGDDIMVAKDVRRVVKDDKLIAIIPINLREFTSIEEGKIAPGAYGELPFWITSLSESIRSYEIKVKMVYNPGSGETPYETGWPDNLLERFLDLLTNEEKEAILNGLTEEDEIAIFAGYTDEEKEEILNGLTEEVKDSLRAELAGQDEEDGLTEEDKDKIAEIEAMIMDHFTVYKTIYRDEEGIVRFKDPLGFYIKETDDVVAAKGSLDYMVEKKDQIYWVWNYEITDIPDYPNLKRFPTYEPEYADTGVITVDENTRREAIRLYDEEDTKLGNYLDNVWFMVYIEGSPERYNENEVESYSETGLNVETGEYPDAEGAEDDSAVEGIEEDSDADEIEGNPESEESGEGSNEESNVDDPDV